jgi:hypothetical protein
MISQSIEPRIVTITGDRTEARVTVRTLIEALEKALIWLRGRDPTSMVVWEVVKISMGNPVRLTFSSMEANGEISGRLRSLHELEKKRKPKIAPRLTDEDIDGTRELASMIGDRFKSMRISSPGEPTVKLTPSLVERVEEIAKTTRGSYYEWGTVRGYMDQVTVGRKASFRIRHQLTDAEISCTFAREQLLDQVKAALPTRVEVYGRIRLNRSNKPTSIDVEKFRVLAGQSKPFDEVAAVNITDGEESSDFVERIRSAG